VLEKVVHHPADPLEAASRFTLAAGVTLFTGVMGLALWRATGKVPILRLIVAGGTAVIVGAAAGVDPVFVLAIAFAGVVVLAVAEQRSAGTS
jgi:hypothetical protein